MFSQLNQWKTAIKLWFLEEELHNAECIKISGKELILMATTKKHTKKTGDSSKKGTVSNGDFS